MRVILVNNYTRMTGGADLHCLELAKGLRERGHEVVFLATADERNIDRDGVFVRTIVTRETRAEMTGIKAAGVACRAIWNPSVASAAKELLSSFRPDVVHVHKLYPQLSVAPVVVASRKHVPIVQTAHDYEFISASIIDDTGSWLDRDEEQPAYRLLNTSLFGVKRFVHAPRVDRWITVSKSASLVYRRHGIDASVLPNFTEAISSVSPGFEGRTGVLFVGRLSEEKGVRHLLELAHLTPGMPISIAGDGPLSDEVRRAAATHQNVTYLGWLDRAAVTRELVSARLVVMPSLWREPAGLAALEAMAAGTPLIAYDSGGLAEYVTDAAAGLIVPPTVTSLAGAIASIYDDRPRWEKFSSDARAAVRRDHTRSVYLDRLEAIYTESIEAH